MRLLFGMLATALAGCHLLFPYQPSSGPGRRDVLLAADQATSDRSRDGRGTELDCGPPPASASCSDADPLASATCDLPECPCGRCDGLPDQRDPWPMRCNRLLFGEAFCDGARWQRAYGDSYVEVKQPGKLRFDISDTNFSVWAWVGPQANLQIRPEELMEIRVEPVAGAWVLRLGVATKIPNANSPFQPLPLRPRSCKLDNRAGLEAVLQSTSGYVDPNVASITLGKLPAALVLQSWVAGGNHHCRLFGPDGAELGHVQVQSVPSESGATVLIEVISDETSPATIDVDYVRIFAPP